MPKQKITKEMVVDAAFDLAREGGASKVLVKDIAKSLGCSVQPIYSYCLNMDSLKKDVIKKISVYFHDYIEANVDKDNLFESTGKLYLRLSKEEPNLFQMYFFGTRSDLDVDSLEKLYETECNPRSALYLSKKYSISEEAARKLQLNMAIYNQGIASMDLACGFKIPLQQLEHQLEQAFKAFLNEIKGEK